jgi:hypothetical protein
LTRLKEAVAKGLAGIGTGSPACTARLYGLPQRSPGQMLYIS